MKTQPNIIDKYLVGNSKEDLIESLRPIEGFIVDDDFAQAGKGFAIDFVGQLVATPGTYDSDGNEITAPVLTDEVHLNVRLIDTKKKGFPVEYDNRAGELEDELNELTLVDGVEILEAPLTPARVFA
jgi:hypothetical protein